MRGLIFILLVWEICILHATSGSYLANARRLYSDLMSHYNDAIIPAQDTNTALDVAMNVKILDGFAFMPDSNTLRLELQVSTEWKDYTMQWDPEEYGDINRINIPAKMLWLPDIVIANSVEHPPREHAGERLVVGNNGMVRHVRKLTSKTHCQIESEGENVHNCSIAFISWTYTGSQLNLKLQADTDSKAVGFNRDTLYNEWQVAEAGLKRTVKLYAHGDEPQIELAVRLRKKE